MDKPIQFIVGLGNPGAEYDNTRHNVGAWLLAMLCDEWGVTLKPEKKFKGEFATLASNDGRPHPLYCLLPTTFMNHSGQAVRAVMQFYKLHPSQILVLHDEIDLPPGVARLKKDGGHAGHNGLRDLISQCQSADFYRLRIGVGHPGDQRLVHDYVLKKPSHAERDAIMDALTEVMNVFPSILAGDTQRAMNQLHTTS